MYYCDLARRKEPAPLDEGIGRYLGSTERPGAAFQGGFHLCVALSGAKIAVDILIVNRVNEHFRMIRPNRSAGHSIASKKRVGAQSCLSV